MNNQQRFLLGVAAGVIGALAGRRLARNTRRIDFSDRVVVITGGSRGLGLVLARKLSAEGARLCLLARDEDELARAAAQFPPGSEVMTVRCDIRRRADVRAAVDAILDRWNVIDILINNAGVIQVGPLEHMTTGDFENAMATHDRRETFTTVVSRTSIKVLDMTAMAISQGLISPCSLWRGIMRRFRCRRVGRRWEEARSAIGARTDN